METSCHTGYLGELQAERGDLDLPQPPEGLQGEHRGAAGQKLYKREEAEVIITDEELQQDVQGAREHAVRHGHGNSQKSALEHIHDGGQRGVGAGEPCHGAAWTGGCCQAREGKDLRLHKARCHRCGSAFRSVQAEKRSRSSRSESVLHVTQTLVSTESSSPVDILLCFLLGK